MEGIHKLHKQGKEQQTGNYFSSSCFNYGFCHFCERGERELYVLLSFDIDNDNLISLSGKCLGRYLGWSKDLCGTYYVMYLS